MLKDARPALSGAFIAWKGGEYVMGKYTSVYIGEHDSSGDKTTLIHLSIADYCKGSLMRQLSSARRASVSNSWFSPQRSGGENESDL